MGPAFVRIRFQEMIGEFEKEDMKQGEYQIYLIFHIDDVKSAKPGGGKSFLADFDPHLGKVVREVHFQ